MPGATPSALSSYVFAARYSQYRKDLGRFETYEEACDRVIGTHETFYAGIDISAEIDLARDALYSRLAIGSQRAMQFGGTAVLRCHARIYNCLEQATQFITESGVKSFKDFKSGDKTSVLTHEGSFAEATVRSYGAQDLYAIVLTRGGAEVTVRATRDHRWLKADGSVTTALQVGDKICPPPHVFQGFDYTSAEPDERQWWCYGFVYGDGTRIKNKAGDYTYSAVRLCGPKRRYLERFQEVGFKHSFPPSHDGDPMVYTGTYLKTTPDLDTTSPRLVRAFVAGFLAADGAHNKNVNSPTKYISIQATGEDECAFIRRAFPMAGVYIVSETDKTGEETNYGARPYTISFRLSQGIAEGGSAPGWSVQSISTRPVAHEVVWCLEVPGPQSFVLPSGLVTGNCSASYADRPRFFQEALWLLLCGCGVGFSVQRQHIAKLPRLRRPSSDSITFVVPDTIEGWSDALGVLLASYGIFDPEEQPQFTAYVGKRVHFDYSLIRPKGAPLSTSSARAPGPLPLRTALERVRKLLGSILGNERTASMAPIHAYDVLMHAADAVRSGGIRRAATLVLFSPDDEDMARAKTGDWMRTNPQRGRSNNSVVLLRGQTSERDFQRYFASTQQFGEPGFLWMDDPDEVLNPCAEIGLYPRLNGKSGFQQCNLSEINARTCKGDIARWERAARAAAILGTLQAGYTSFPYLMPVSEEITRREALLGVSMTGMADNPQYAFDPQLQQHLAKIVLDTNEVLAAKLGINPAARATCVKPSGNAACVLDTSSGIHPAHAPRYFRRTQATDIEEPLRLFREANPRAVEKSVWNSAGTDYVVTFCVEAEPDATTKQQVGALDLLRHVQTTQQNWVTAGRRPERCVLPSSRHNVSNTINVRDEEWNDVAKFIYENRNDLAGVSLLSHSGDLDYPQAPFCAVKTEEQMLQAYGSGVLLASGLIVDGMAAFADNLWAACDVVLGIGEDIMTDVEPPAETPAAVVTAMTQALTAKREWVRRARQFAVRYFNGDMRRMTHCLKDVHLFKLWLDLSRDYKPVDWSQMRYVEREIAPDAACAGGACSTSYV